jgi:hypothetical protein
MAEESTTPTTKFVGTEVSSLDTIFNDIEEVYFSKTAIESADTLKTIAEVIELPVLEDGVTFNTGEAEITQIKLTTEAIWTSKSKRGDADISFNVPSVSKTITDLFMNTKTDSVTDVSINGEKYGGTGYNLNAKKVVGALILPSQDKSVAIVLPKVELYASFNAADGDNPAYFSVKATPVKNNEGVEIYILQKATT